MMTLGSLLSPATGSPAANRTGILRIALGLLFGAAGINKLTSAKFKESWRQQIVQTDLPFPELTRSLGPFAEIGSAALLLTGYRARLGALSVVGMMVVALRVHRETDAEFLPMGSKQPTLPLVSMFMAAMVLLHGAGSWVVRSHN